MDWTASGIEHEWAYELVDAVNLKSRGQWLDGVSGGSITEGYRSENRSMCTLELDGAAIPWGCAVRVHHTARLGSETFSEVLGTFQPEPLGGTYEHGRVHGSVDLYSSLKKLSTHYYKGVSGVKKGTNIVNHFRTIVADGQCVPYPIGVSTSKGFGADYSWVRPKESDYAEAQRCADALGAYLGVDAQGRVTLQPYVQPKSRPVEWTLDSIVEIGVEIAPPEIVNRVVVDYEHNASGKTKTYTAMATLGEANKWSYQKIGRFETIQATPPTFDDSVSASQIQSALNKLVSQELAAAQSKNVYSVGALYHSGIRCATAGRLIYSDSPDDSRGIDAKVFCSERVVSLDYTAGMQLTLEEL